MTSLVHPFVARCHNVMEDARGKYFLMEALCGGELCELLYFENRFSEEWGMFYSASVLAAFAHMHERKVAYRDLKPENLVLDDTGYVKIVDFGLAKVIKGGQTYTFCGTPDYLAPEVILSEGHDWAVDYWGLGVLIFEMTEGVAPFYAENPMDVSAPSRRRETGPGIRLVRPPPPLPALATLGERREGLWVCHD